MKSVDGLVPLVELLEWAEEMASVSAWEGNMEVASAYDEMADVYRKRLKKGELYEPTF